GYPINVLSVSDVCIAVLNLPFNMAVIRESMGSIFIPESLKKNYDDDNTAGAEIQLAVSALLIF
ncbi:MAG: hypothetical protein LUC41_00655, partial [Clostridiales bacterium]|nr:hypothetical protein [Clostridiales bacterium]